MTLHDVGYRSARERLTSSCVKGKSSGEWTAERHRNARFKRDNRPQKVLRLLLPEPQEDDDDDDDDDDDEDNLSDDKRC